MVLVLAHCLIMLYISTKFFEIISRVSEIFSRHDFCTEIYNRAYFFKKCRYVGEVTVLVLCTCLMTLYNLEACLSYLVDRISILKFTIGHFM